MQYEIRFYKLYILYIKKACWIQTKVWMSIFFCPKTHPITPKVFRPNSVRNLQGFGNLEGFVLLLETVKRFGNALRFCPKYFYERLYLGIRIAPLSRVFNLKINHRSR